MKGKIFWGLLFILMAVYIVIGQLGIWNPVGVWPAIVTVLCVAMFVSGVVDFSFFGMLFPIAILCILYRGPLGLGSISPWSMLVVAALASIGLEMIFGKVKKKAHYKAMERRMKKMQGAQFGENAAQVEQSEFDVETRFGSEVRYVRSEDFCYATVDAKFSGVKLYFTETKVPQGNATLELDVQFAGVEIYVPGNWQVINHADASFGGVDEKGMKTAETSTTLTLQGRVSFGGVTVHYV